MQQRYDSKTVVLIGLLGSKVYGDQERIEKPALYLPPGREKYAGTPPEWGAIVLVEVATGDVLAMASFHAKADACLAAFAPAAALGLGDDGH